MSARVYFMKRVKDCKDDIEFVTEFPCFLGHPVLDIHVLFIKAVFIFICGLSSKVTCAFLANYK